MSIRRRHRAWSAVYVPPMRILQVALALAVIAASAVTSMSVASGAGSEPRSPYLNYSLRHAEKPKTLGFCCVPEDDPLNVYLSSINWSSWGGASAEATAKLELRSEGASKSEKSRVKMTATKLVSCGGQPIYTHVDLSIAEGAAEPARFAEVRSTELEPCRIHVRNYVGGESERRKVEQGADIRQSGDCIMDAMDLSKKGSPSRNFWNLLCRMKWRRWGASSSTGIGIARQNNSDGTITDFAARVVVSRVAWCGTYGMSYTRKTVTIYGRGVRHSRPHAIPADIEQLVRRQLGQRPQRVYHDAMPAAVGCDSPTGY